TGTASVPNTNAITGSGTDILIGGTNSGEGNLISGNINSAAITLIGTNWTIQGNLIGTDVTGTSALSNGAGIVVLDSTNAIIGGSSGGARNVISGSGFGVFVTTFFGIGSSGTVIQGNYIGTDITGASALGNLEFGVMIDVSVAGAVVGGRGSGEGNVIAF